ncbi:MAG: tetratricopeptide repeat protein [Oscillochloris sp.]|nr:tetratricopeptide repeat protein [Oscillochloris sp.]
MLTPAESIGLALAQGEVAAFRGQRAEAQHSFEAALAQLATTPTEEAIRREQARACRGMGQVLESEQPQAALQWFERGLEAIDGTNPLEQARISNRMGYLHLQLGTFAKARSILEAALVSLPVEQVRMRADLLVNLGSVCAASGAYTTGREHLHTALPMMRRIGNRWAEAGILQNLGMIFDISGDWEAAEASYRQALQLAEELGETQRRSEVLLALGILQTNRSQYTSALAYLEQALALADAQGARVNCVYIYSSLADLYVRMGRIESAAITAKHAEDWAEKLGERSQLPEILRTQALVALGQNEQTRALALAERALALAHEQGNAEDMGQCLRVRAEVSLAHNDVFSALADCATSVTLLAENPYQHAQTQLVWGKALTISGDSDSGAHQIELARTAFTRLGIQI